MNIVKKFLLVYLHLIIALLMCQSQCVKGLQDGGSLIDSNYGPFGTATLERPNFRAYRLFHQCSSKHVVIQDKVSATGTGSDEKEELVLETVMLPNANLRIRIRGLISDKYLCYNRRGRIVSKPKSKARGKKCEFEEIHDGQYWRFRSVLDSKWFVGFNHKGKPLYGSAHVLTRREDCFRFSKQKVDMHSSFSSSSFDDHNKGVGQTHPGLSPDFVYKAPLSPPSDALYTTKHHLRHRKNPMLAQLFSSHRRNKKSQLGRKHVASDTKFDER